MENKKIEVAVFGGGCFWCLQALFPRIKGVEKVVSGYAGGEKENPTYEEVSSGETGHAEVNEIGFNPEIISYKDLLYVFFYAHNPTTLNCQGNDVGTQYRSVIFYTNEEQHKIAEDFIKDLTEKKAYDKPIVTQLVPLEKFYPAEEYHQQYFEKNPKNAYCQMVVAPKLKKFSEIFKKYHK